MKVHHYNPHDDCKEADNQKKNLKCIMRNRDQMNEIYHTTHAELNSGSLALLDCKDNVIGGISVNQHIHPGYYEYKNHHTLRDLAKHIQQSVKQYACFLTQPAEDQADDDAS